MRPGGELRWAEVRAVVDHDAGLCHIVARDITEPRRGRRRAARATPSATRRPAWRSSRPDGAFLRVNDALCADARPQRGGAARDERAGRSRESPRGRASAGSRDHFADGAPGSFQLEARLRTDDGGAVVALVSGTLVRDPAGQPLHYLCQFQDVTERNAAQEALAANEAKLAEAQQVARLGSWEWLIADDRVTWSDELYRIHGLRPEPVGQSWAHHLERVHPDDRARVARAIEQAVAEARAWSIDHRILRPDGDVRIVHARGEVVLDEDGARRRRPRHLPGRHRGPPRRGRAARRRAALPPRLRRLADRHGADRPRGPLAAPQPRDRADGRAAPRPSCARRRSPR